MQVIRDPANADVFTDPVLHHLITQVFANVIDCPEILGFVLVVEPGDTLAMLEVQLGFPILANRHEFIEDHGDWFELVFVTGQDGYGYEVFVPKSGGIDPDLLTMCQRFASPAETGEAAKWGV